MKRTRKAAAAHTSRFPPGFSLRGRSRDVLRTLLDEPLVSADELRREIAEYVAAVHARAQREEFVDVRLVDRVGDACLGLLSAIGDEAPPESRRLVQAAIRYFILESDADSDFSSVVGFDDDAEVVNAVARYLQRTDLVVEVS
jgi:uncharacterized membrane protein YkvA (DUF1232 family)